MEFECYECEKNFPYEEKLDYIDCDGAKYFCKKCFPHFTDDFAYELSTSDKERLGIYLEERNLMFAKIHAYYLELKRKGYGEELARQLTNVIINTDTEIQEFYDRWKIEGE